jgi:hypothetical protein
MEKALDKTSSSHKKITQEKVKHLQLLNGDLDASIKLKRLMPKDSSVADSIYNLIKDKDPTLGDYEKITFKWRNS